MALQLSIDLGASSTKAAYTIDGKNLYFMKMDSEIVKAPLEIVGKGLKLNGGLPEDSAWVSYRKKDAEVYLLGHLAKQIQIHKKVKEAKYRSAINKILGVVGAIVSSHQQLASKYTIDLELNLLIPIDEYSSQDIFLKKYKSQLRKFYFKDRLICSKVKKFHCFPEGYGGLISIANRDRTRFNMQTIVILMFGHRNCSFLKFERGSFQEGDTLSLGFYDFLISIKNFGIAQNLDLLEKIIPLIGNQLNPDNKLFYTLTHNQSKEERQQEIEQLISVIQKMKQKNWLSIRNWLDIKIPKIVDEIVVMGGASRYFLEEIEDFFSWTKLNFVGELATEVKQILPKKLKFSSELDDSNIMGFRFADVYGIHKYEYK